MDSDNGVSMDILKEDMEELVGVSFRIFFFPFIFFFHFTLKFIIYSRIYHGFGSNIRVLLRSPESYIKI